MSVQSPNWHAPFTSAHPSGHPSQMAAQLSLCAERHFRTLAGWLADDERHLYDR